MLSKLGDVLDKINVRPICQAHLRTLFNNRTERPSRADRALFFGLPVFLATALVALGVEATDTAALLGAVAFLGGFLFALLILVLQMAAGAAAETEDSGVHARTLRRVVVLRELSGNVSYAVLLCIVTTAVLIVGTFTEDQVFVQEAGKITSETEQPWWYTGLMLAALAHLGLTLLMILKRLFVVINRELSLASVPVGQE